MLLKQPSALFWSDWVILSAAGPQRREGTSRWQGKLMWTLCCLWTNNCCLICNLGILTWSNFGASLAKCWLTSLDLLTSVGHAPLFTSPIGLRLQTVTVVWFDWSSFNIDLCCSFLTVTWSFMCCYFECSCSFLKQNKLKPSVSGCSSVYSPHHLFFTGS